MISVAILTVSDSAFAGTREDLSGPALHKRCDELGWRVVANAVLPDDEALISRQLVEWADATTAELIVTTGGTGVSSRDRTPEATGAVLERELPGVSELMRTRGLEQTHLAVLSRGLTGTLGKSFIVNLPGSPRGALFSFGVIENLAPHVIKLLRGETEHEAKETEARSGTSKMKI